MDELRYPVGRFHFDPAVTEQSRAQAIEAIAAMPIALRGAVLNLDERQLATRYRPDGWSVRQVVHHLADSHMNACFRFRLTLTEEEPTVPTYREAAWAQLVDAREAPIELSLALLDALHERWVRLLRSLTSEELQRTLRHPDHGVLTVDHLLQMYAWHGRHHVAHITSLRAREHW